MKFYVVLFVFSTIVLAECGHTFIGTNVQRPLILHRNVQYDSKYLQKRIENFNYTLPYFNRIQGILAYDMTSTGASANVTRGGVGQNYVNLRMKSDRGKKLDYDIYIYV